MDKKISIIIPVYNVEEYLDKCISSVVNQTYKELEIILINDGSTDKSLDICNKWRKKDNRIYVINQKNSGVSSARNVGLEYASGDYIAFIDSDDWVDKEMYEILLDNAIKYNADIIESEVKYVFPTEIVCKKNEQPIICNRLEAMDYFLSNYQYFKPTVWNKLYKKDIIINLKFPENVQLGEEGFFTYRAIYNSEKLVYINQGFYNFLQQRPGSTMSMKTFTLKKLDALKSFKERTVFLLEKGHEKLAVQSYNEYLSTLIRYYYLAFISENDNENVQNILKKEIKHNISLALESKDNTLRVKYRIFKFCPKFYIYFEKFKDDLLKRI